jgi:uncharacterized protein with HEPN domain
MWLISLLIWKGRGFVEGFDEAVFQSDEKTRFTVRCLEVIGEAAKHVPEQVRQFPRFHGATWPNV